MRRISKLLLFGLLTSTFAVQCKTHNSSDKSTTKTTKLQVPNITANTKFDTVNEQLNSNSELMTEDLVALKIIDTALATQLSETCYCDTTVHLNDSVYYSVISANDEAGLCTYFFVASLNKKNKKIIGSELLYPDCDVDYSQDSYELYEHSVVSKDKIQITKTTIFQKKNRTSANEEENIDHTQTVKNFISISETGQMSNAN